jgi:hypothetical protein
MLTSGRRVRNTYATFLKPGHNLEKSGLIPHNIAKGHLIAIKDSSV